MEQDLGFIKDRIQEIKSALLYNESNSESKLPTSIIRSLDVDQEGNIWFFMNDSGFNYQPEELKFPARLNFYRKGKPFFVNIEGIAHVVNDNIVVENYVGQPDEYEIVQERIKLVKVKIERADYHEWSETPAPSLWQRAIAYIKSLFQNKSHNRYSKQVQPHYSFS